jgi:hypothetical protein
MMEPINHDAYLTGLIREQRQLKEQLDEIQARYKALSDAIDAVNRLRQPEQMPAPSIMVDADEFKGLSIPAALYRALARQATPLLSAVLADALCRGGINMSDNTVRENVRGTLKVWRRREWVNRDENTSLWSMTPLGRSTLKAKYAPESTEPSPLGEQSLFAARR